MLDHICPCTAGPIQIQIQIRYPYVRHYLALSTGVYEEDIERALWMAGLGIVHKADDFEKTQRNTARGFDVRGALVYYTNNSADDANPRTVRFGYRQRGVLGRELVLVTVRCVAAGEQLLATNYMEDVTRKRKRQRC